MTLWICMSHIITTEKLYRVHRGWQAVTAALDQAALGHRPTPPDRRRLEPSPTQKPRRWQPASRVRWPALTHRWRCVRSDLAGSWRRPGGLPSQAYTLSPCTSSDHPGFGRQTGRRHSYSFSVNNNKLSSSYCCCRQGNAVRETTPWAIKKRATLFGIITPMFRGGFLHFLHQWKRGKILYRGVTKFATLPQLCLLTTWENLKTHITAHFETNCQCILMLNAINGKNDSKWTVSSSC